MVKQADGSFELTVPLPSDATVLYKYVVDGEWLTNSDQKLAEDETGNVNNVLEAADFAAESTGSKIPEAGGLAVAPAGTVNTTVMPSTEGQQTTLGEPGIFVPTDPEALAAFENVRDVDPKTLNEEAAAPAVPLTAEEKKKNKKKLKRSQYKAKKKQQKAAGSSTTDTSAVEPSPTPEPETLDPAVVGVVGAIGGAALAGVAGAGALGAVAVGAGAAGIAGTASQVTGGAAAAEAPVQAETEAIPGAFPDASTEAAPAEAAEVANGADAEIAPEATEAAPVADEAVVGATEVPEVASPVVDSESTPAELNTDAAENTTENGAVAAPVAEAKEVDAAPVAKNTASYESEEEIIIAQGDVSAKDVQAQLGHIDVEEIKPTESEAKRLAQEAKIPDQPKTKAPAKTTKKEQKKKSGFMAKLKKLFK